LWPNTPHQAPASCASLITPSDGKTRATAVEAISAAASAAADNRMMRSIG
jgi:hypothetical protein